jgi:hypothetical protein
MQSDNIFNYAYSQPTGETDEVNDTAHSFMNMALSQMSWFTGCKYKKISLRTLLFENSTDEFKTLSGQYQMTWEGKSFLAVVSCPYPDFITHDDVESFVRLYAKHPINRKTIYAAIPDI